MWSRWQRPGRLGEALNPVTQPPELLLTEDLNALVRRLVASFFGRCVLRFFEMSGIDRCLVLSSQAFTALIPLLIVVSALAPSSEDDILASSLVRKFGLSGDSAAAVEALFSAPDAATASVSGFSAVLLLFSGLSFTRRVQQMYLAAFRQEKAGVRGGLFAAFGLLALLIEILALYGIRSLFRRLPADWQTELDQGALSILAVNI